MTPKYALVRELNGMLRSSNIPSLNYLNAKYRERKEKKEKEDSGGALD
jgi:hypothetical protein